MLLIDFVQGLDQARSEFGVKLRMGLGRVWVQVGAKAVVEFKFEVKVGSELGPRPWSCIMSKSGPSPGLGFGFRYGIQVCEPQSELGIGLRSGFGPIS